MSDTSLQRILELLSQKEPRYHPEAYQLVWKAMDLLARKWATEGRRDFRAHEVMEAFKEVTLQEFGPLSLLVLEEWGVKSTRDIGNLVFNMVELGLLGKSPEDRIEDFDHGFDFQEAFKKPFLPDGDEEQPNSSPTQ